MRESGNHPNDEGGKIRGVLARRQEQRTSGHFSAIAACTQNAACGSARGRAIMLADATQTNSINEQCVAKKSLSHFTRSALVTVPLSSPSAAKSGPLWFPVARNRCHSRPYHRLRRFHCSRRELEPVGGGEAGHPSNACQGAYLRSHTQDDDRIKDIEVAELNAHVECVLTAINREHERPRRQPDSLRVGGNIRLVNRVTDRHVHRVGKAVVGVGQKKGAELFTGDVLPRAAGGTNRKVEVESVGQPMHPTGAAVR